MNVLSSKEFKTVISPMESPPQVILEDGKEDSVQFEFLALHESCQYAPPIRESAAVDGEIQELNIDSLLAREILQTIGPIHLIELGCRV